MDFELLATAAGALPFEFTALRQAATTCAQPWQAMYLMAFLQLLLGWVLAKHLEYCGCPSLSTLKGAQIEVELG
jgi:hypothetical protein